MIIVRLIYNAFFHPLSSYPGPLLWGASDVPKVVQQMKGTIHDAVLELHEKYGAVVRIAPGELSYITAGAWKDIYGNRQGLKPMPPNPIYGIREKEFFGALGLLWLEDFDSHLRHRRVISPAFSDKSLSQQEALITKHVDLLMLRLRERTSQAVDMWAWFNYTTFDIIGDLTFGEPFGCLENSQMHPWISFIFSRLNMMMYGQIIDTLGFWGKIIEAMVPRRIKDQALHHVRSTKSKVDKRRSRLTGRPDFMTHILSHVGKASGISLSELYADSQILVMAGSETSATLLAVAVFYLLKNPATMERLKAEVRSTFSSENEITFATISKLLYLLAVINESLRIHPPLPAGVNRRVPKDGAVVMDRFVPAGTNLQVPHWAAYHSRTNFKHPWAFIPERWLEGDNTFADDNKDVFQPFSFGPRACIGRSLAYMEMRIILARLVWNFDLALRSESAKWNQQRVFLLYEKKPLMVNILPVNGRD